jgi:3-oxoacyl-ACP reductase-like protein
MDKEVLDRFDKAEEERQELESRVAKIETYFAIALGVAVLLGIGGGVLGWLLSTARAEIARTQAAIVDLQKAVDSAKTDLRTAADTAIQEVTAAKAKAVHDLRDGARAEIRPAVRQEFEAWATEEREARKLLARWVYFVFKEAQHYGTLKQGYANADWQQSLRDNADLVKSQLGFQAVATDVRKTLK